MVPLLEVMARFEMPWWCFARADALLNLSDRSWELVRRSRLRMAYIGAESPNGQMLKDIRKGTRPDQTVDVVKLCRRHGVIPELSFMVAPPENTEEETERTFEFIRDRSEEHTSELQSLMRISYAVFCLKKKNIKIRVRVHNIS